MAEFPAKLDALTAAPANHRLLLENDRVRVLETVVAAGTSTPVHTHRWASVEYVLSATDEGGTTVREMPYSTLASAARNCDRLKPCGPNRFRPTQSRTSVTRSYE